MMHTLFCFRVIAVRPLPSDVNAGLQILVRFGQKMRDGGNFVGRSLSFTSFF